MFLVRPSKREGFAMLLHLILKLNNCILKNFNCILKLVFREKWSANHLTASDVLLRPRYQLVRYKLAFGINFGKNHIARGYVLTHEFEYVDMVRDHD